MSVNGPVPLAVRRGLRAVLRPTVRLEVRGGERLPTTRQPLVIACNHASFLDTVYCALAIRPRFVVCGAKPRLFRNAGLRAVMAVGNVLKVEDHALYLADCAALLAEGEILLTYPEMGRFPDGMGPFSTWPAEVALAAGAPILPCFLQGTGTERLPVVLTVGERLAPTGTAEALTERMRAAVEALA